MNLNNFIWEPKCYEGFEETVTREVFVEKIYEKYFEVEKGDVVFDVGASLGPFTYSILDKNPSHIYCIEPSVEQFHTLVKNTLTGYVTCINKGISDKDGIQLLNNVYGLVEKSLEVYTLRFDTFIRKYDIKQIDFLKTDCEGCEYDIFNRENIWWIKNNVRKIVGEWHLETPLQKQKFREFRDIYLKLFENYEILSVDKTDIKWDLWNDHFIDYYNQILIYLQNNIGNN